MSAPRDLTVRVAEARAAFDRGFAEPPSGAPAATVDLLAIRVGGTPYALRIAELRELAACPRVVPVPSAAPALLGVAGLRGALVPVFSLAILLGDPGAGVAPRWLATCGAPDALGLGFDALDGHLRVPAGELFADPRGGAVREAVRLGDVARAVISLPLILGMLQPGGTT